MAVCFHRLMRPGYPLAKSFRRDILGGYLFSRLNRFIDLGGKRIFEVYTPGRPKDSVGQLAADLGKFAARSAIQQPQQFAIRGAHFLRWQVGTLVLQHFPNDIGFV
jgi:hypothetical protein